MTPLQQAHAAGMTEVLTGEGWIPLSGWSLPANQLAEFDAEAKRLRGFWRKPTALEDMFHRSAYAAGTVDPAWLARDCWEVRP